MKEKTMVLLTGGTGFLGSQLASQLLGAGHQVIILKRKASSLARLQTLPSRPFFYDIADGFNGCFERWDVTHIVHVATAYGREHETMADVLEANVTLPTALLQCAYRHAVKGFLNADTFFHEDVGLTRQEQLYTIGKKAFLAIAKAAALADPKVKFFNFRIEQMYGPNDKKEKFVAAIISQLCSGIKTIPLTAGRQKRDFVYVEDVARAFVQAIGCFDPLDTFEEFGIGTGTSRSIRDVVKLLRQMTGSQAALRWGTLPYRINEIMDSQADTRNNQKIHWRADTSLEDGLAKTIAASV